MASSGGVGAVRRTRHLSGRARALSFIAVLALFASGTGHWPREFAAPAGSEQLAGFRGDGAGAPSASDTMATDEQVASAPVAPATTLDAPAPAVEVPVVVPTTAAAAGERAIVAPPAFPRARTAAAPRATRTDYAPGPKGAGVWAVVVGIDDYPGDDADLRAAVADARDVDSALAAYGVPANRRLMLLDKDATAANIRGALAWIAGRASVDSTAVFFYSGHVRQVAGDPDRDGEVIDEALVGADGENVHDGQVADLLRGLDARSVWLGIAACYGAGFDDALAPGRILTAAAGENDIAYENSSLGHSYLVEYMVRRAMLQGHAAGSVQEAFAWARAQIARDYPNRQPSILDRSRGPVVLGRATPAPPAPAPERKPTPSTPPPERQDPQPAPSAPPPTAPEPQPGGQACAQVLGVSVCSEQR